MFWVRWLLIAMICMLPHVAYAQDHWLEAVWQGDTVRAQEWLQDGVDVNVSDHWGRTALLIAAQKGDLAMAELLLAYHPDVKRYNRNGITPLIAAAQRGNAKLTTLLLSEGADVNTADVMGWTPVMWAARNGNQDCLKVLLQAGANIAVRTRENQSLSDLADQYGYSQEVRSLLHMPGWNEMTVTSDASINTPNISPTALHTSYRPDISPDRPLRGHADAPITIVVYTDLQCSYCAEGAKTVEHVVQKYAGKVRMLVKHNPLVIHPYANQLALLYEAIAFQDPNKAWQFYDTIMHEQQRLRQGQSFIERVVDSLSVDKQKLQQDLNSPDVQQRLADDRQELNRFHIEGVPVFLINGILVDGAQPESAFTTVIDRLLTQEHPAS